MITVAYLCLAVVGKKLTQAVSAFRSLNKEIYHVQLLLKQLQIAH